MLMGPVNAITVGGGGSERRGGHAIGVGGREDGSGFGMGEGSGPGGDVRDIGSAIRTRDVSHRLRLGDERSHSTVDRVPPLGLGAGRLIWFDVIRGEIIGEGGNTFGGDLGLTMRMRVTS